MTTFTNTIAPAVLHRRQLQLEPTQRLTSLLEEMTNAVSGLSNEHQKEVAAIIRAWEKQFFSTYKINSQSVTDLEDAAGALITFRLNNVEFIMHEYAKNDSEKLKWMQFYNELGSLATSILPRGTDVDAFIKANETNFRKCKFLYSIDQSIQEIMKRVNALFDRQEQFLVEGFNHTNSEFQSEFEAIKAVLLNLNSERKTSFDESHAEIDALTETVTQIYKQLEQQLKESKEHGNDIRKQEAILDQLQDRSDAICAKAGK